MDFYNRRSELEVLGRRWNDPAAQFALLYGRRRLGKTYLLEYFLRQDKPHAYFLASQTSLHENVRQLAESVLAAAPDSGYTPDDLPTLASILGLAGNIARDRRFALVLDEFQYLLEQDQSIPSQIQAWWDKSGIRSEIFLVLCGSHLGMMEGLGGPQAPLFGRFTFRHKLPPMSYADTASFYAGSDYSVRDKLMAYAVLGGTPRYHAAFDSHQDLGASICEHILSPMGFLHNEPEVLLSSSRVRDAAPYNAILHAVAEGCTRFNEISLRVGISSSQQSFYVRNLADLDWLAREYPFDESSDRRAIYRITDHFVRFWYRFVAGNRSRLEFGDPLEVYENRVKPHLSDYIGFEVFEDICRQYLRTQGTRVAGQPIQRASRYWSRDGRTEIDIMAELSDGHYLFGECKWSAKPVGMAVYYELRNKVAALPSRKYQDSPRYVIFSTAGFDDHLTQTAAREGEGLVLVSGDDLLA